MTERCDECGQSPEWCHCEAFTVDARHPAARNLPDDEERETGLAAIAELRNKLKGTKQ